MKYRTNISPWMFFQTLVLIFILFIGNPSAGVAKTKRHLIVHAGLSVFNLAAIAQNVDYLVVSNARIEHLAHMKEINPDLIILRYHHALGVHKNTPQWEKIKNNEDVFVHDAITHKRIIEKKYGWYLLNNSTKAWRRSLTDKIINNTDEIHDGIFIDDFWVRYVNKFIAEDHSAKATPREKIIPAWEMNMIIFLKHIRSIYPKLIFINGPHEEYIRYVDGCMDEGFVHGNWQSDKYFPNPARYMRSILKIRRLSGYGKKILVQSGTFGDYPANIEKIYNLCFSSYFLVSNRNTTFGFHPLYTYYFKGFPNFDNYNLDLGEAKGPYEQYRVINSAPNLLSDSEFGNGLERWHIISGRPTVDSQIKTNGNSIMFVGTHDRHDMIRSDFIPVKVNTDYRIAVQSKTENNLPGDARYKKLGLQGRFYDKNHKRIAGAFDLQFAPGTYDWLPFEITHRSPPNAAFFRIRIGFIGNGMGKGWVNNVFFGEALRSAKILRREFSKGFVFVNYGLKDAVITPGSREQPQHIQKIPIGARQGMIIQSDGLHNE
jgi:hypothetical protein